VRCATDNRKTLEKLCCYITRPALVDERLKTNIARCEELRRSCVMNMGGWQPSN
jgi:hypothetical protein